MLKGIGRVWSESCGRCVPEITFPAIRIKFSGLLTLAEADAVRCALAERIAHVPLEMHFADGRTQTIYFDRN